MLELGKIIPLSYITAAKLLPGDAVRDGGSLGSLQKVGPMNTYTVERTAIQPTQVLVSTKEGVDISHFWLGIETDQQPVLESRQIRIGGSLSEKLCYIHYDLLGRQLDRNERPSYNPDYLILFLESADDAVASTLFSDPQSLIQEDITLSNIGYRLVRLLPKWEEQGVYTSYQLIDMAGLADSFADLVIDIERQQMIDRHSQMISIGIQYFRLQNNRLPFISSLQHLIQQPILQRRMEKSDAHLRAAHTRALINFDTKYRAQQLISSLSSRN